MMASTRVSVAIVDDEESVRVGMRRLCNALGFAAVAYGSGLEFIDSLDAGGARPDCLLLDAHMPDMTGLEVQQNLVARSARFPTIVYTADDAPEAQARHLAAGAADYLRKPIGGDELLAAIDRALAAHAPAPLMRRA